ncbi:hypothetical protein M8J77_012784 [Diaphorina citri]|nr:hypothetical protein M8J77_012784 [Diaphorina citri]
MPLSSLSEIFPSSYRRNTACPDISGSLYSLEFPEKESSLKSTIFTIPQSSLKKRTKWLLKSSKTYLGREKCDRLI